HSLPATRVVSRIRAAFGAELPLRALFETPTVAGLAARVEAAGGAGRPRPGSIRRVERGGELPLSFAQQRLWFLDQLEPARSTYNMPLALRVGGGLDSRALERALSRVARRHESLRTRFPSEHGRAVQLVEPPRPMRLPEVDLGGLPDQAREAELQRLVADEARRPFDLAAGPLLRGTVVRLGGEDAAVFLTMHHIVSDGWSMEIFSREVSQLYRGCSRGEEPRLPELPIQYADYAAWQHAWLSGDNLAAQLVYWRESLAGAPALLELPTDRPRPAVAAHAGAWELARVGEETVEGLRALGRREGATPFMTLLAAWQMVLARYAGQESVVVGTPVAGRTRVETEGLIGLFVNTLALRATVPQEATFRDLLRQVRETTLGAYQHQEVPFEKVVEELRVERSLAYTPIFQVMFALQNNERGALDLGSAGQTRLGSGAEPAKFDLALYLAEAEGGIRGALSYRVQLWDRGTMERLLEHFGRVLETVAAEPGRRLGEVSLLGEAERAQVVREFNATAREHPREACVHDLFAAQAARTPAAVAVRFAGEALSYAELDRRSSRLARHLRSRGVGPEACVGVLMERTPGLVVALLGVLRAGGAYVPLDPAYPRDRLGWMLDDARARVVLTTSALAARLPEGSAAPVCLDTLALPEGEEHEAAPRTGVGPENLSHVIFTSGSTGRPKGVMVRHGSVAALLHWLREIVTDEERSAVLFSTSVSFDVSVAELFGTLCWGGTLVLVENALELARVSEPVVYASMVPTAAAELVRTGGIPASVKTLNLAGEALSGELAQALYALGTVEKVGNVYGPTEDTTYSTYSLVEKGGGRVTIGRPMANTQAYVLDGAGEPVPVGVPGELYLGGAGVARGYLDRPELTAETFVPDPFLPEGGGRLYRTGDRVRWLSSGELEYFGRADKQVKVRGFRVEPGEIEAALGRHPGVREAVVVVSEDVAGERRLVAYCTAGAQPAPAPGELREHLRGSLPEYMVPSAFVLLDAL
ncbi:MAG TPA: amino acid adenylation domain-containing protein, partial [Longimicrobiaceae bacterium]|nr:amino acid adenylation domain-containing protein [Longimicrobiaceae bacterium]